MIDAIIAFQILEGKVDGFFRDPFKGMEAAACLVTLEVFSPSYEQPPRTHATNMASPRCQTCCVNQTEAHAPRQYWLS